MILRRSSLGERDPERRALLAPLGKRHRMIEERKRSTPRCHSRICASCGYEPLVVLRTSSCYREGQQGRGTAGCHRAIVLAVPRLRLPPGDCSSGAPRADRKPQASVVHHAPRIASVPVKRRFVPTTDSAHALGRCPRLLKEALIDVPGTVWSANITYMGLPGEPTSATWPQSSTSSVATVRDGLFRGPGTPI